MTTFTGSITKLATRQVSYPIGAYPELLVDIWISARDISMFEDQWHAYLVALDLASNQIARAIRSDFGSLGLFSPWPNPDVRAVKNVVLPLIVPLPAEGLDVAVQLYGSTVEWEPQAFLEQKVILIAPTTTPPGTPPEEKETNYTPYLVGGVALFLLGAAVVSSGKRR